MPAFAMIGHDGPDGATQRRQHRQAHIDHITRLHENGQILFAGPIKNEERTRSVGAIIVLAAQNLTEAKSIVSRDPYVSGRVFETLTVEPFQQVLPEPS